MVKRLAVAVLMFCTVMAIAAFGAPHSVTLSWIPDASAATQGVSYNIYRHDSSTTSYTAPLNSSPISPSSLVCAPGQPGHLCFTDLTVKVGKNYFYVVRAFKTTATPPESVNSNEVTALIRPTAPVLNQPTVTP